MPRPWAWLVGGFALFGWLRRRREPVALGSDPRAEELRRKLAESRALVDEREEFEGAELTVDLRPYRIRSESHRITQGLGRAAVVDFRYEIQCVTRACVPTGKGRGADAVQLEPATASYRTREGRTQAQIARSRPDANG